MARQTRLGDFHREKEMYEATEDKEFQGPYELPEGWKWVKLGDIAKISAGGTPSRSIKEYWNGNIPWVKISDIPEYDLVLDTEEKITEEGLKNSNAKIFPKGTILFSIFATIAKVGILGIDAATNQAIAGIQIKNTGIIDQRYLFYCLKKFGASLIGRGMAQRNINQTILRNLEIPLPPLEEQKRIVSRLNELVSRAEEAKRLKKQAKEEAEKIMQAALNKVFSRVEEEWSQIKIGEIMSLKKGKKPAKLFAEKIDGSLPYLTAQFMRNLEEPKYCLYDGNITVVKPSDVLIIMDGSYSGDVFTGFSGVLASTMAKFVFSEQKILPKYLYYFLKMNFKILNIKTKGATIPHVRKDVLFGLEIPLSPLEEQKKIVTYLDKLRETVESLKKLQQKTEEELEKLVPVILDKAFKGEL